MDAADQIKTWTKMGTRPLTRSQALTLTGWQAHTRNFDAAHDG